MRMFKALRGVCVVACIATTVTLALGAGVGLAADYQDANGNVCEGNFEFTGGCEWGTHVTGSDNVALGKAMMPELTSGTGNVALDFGALAADATGTDNVGIGREALVSNTTGSSSVALGAEAGFNLTTGSNNIDISNAGVAAEGGATRIGTEGKQTQAFVAGIYPTNLAGCFVQVTPAGELGCNPTAAAEGKEGKEGAAGKEGKEGAPGKDGAEGKEGKEGAPGKDGAEGKEGKEGPPGKDGAEGKEGKEGAPGKDGAEGKEGATGKEGKEGAPGKEGKEGKTGATGPAGSAAIATFRSTKPVASGHCLDATENAAQGNGVCPGPTTGYSISPLLDGPTPANGATVTDLYADSNATVTGSETAFVAVVDNTTGTTLLSCTVNSASKGHCSNASGSGSVAGGDNIEVKVTVNGSSASQWRVRFRY
jgi:hypothetical protein